MPQLVLGYIQVSVTDLAAAQDFYVRRLGLVATTAAAAPVTGPFTLSAPGSPPVVIYPVSGSSHASYPESPGVVLVFECEDLAEGVGTLQSRGVEFVPTAGGLDPLQPSPSPVGSYVAFRDPFGTVHELLERSGNGGNGMS